MPLTTAEFFSIKCKIETKEIIKICFELGWQPQYGSWIFAPDVSKGIKEDEELLGYKNYLINETLTEHLEYYILFKDKIDLALSNFDFKEADRITNHFSANGKMWDIYQHKKGKYVELFCEKEIGKLLNQYDFRGADKIAKKASISEHNHYKIIKKEFALRNIQHHFAIYDFTAARYLCKTYDWVNKDECISLENAYITEYCRDILSTFFKQNNFIEADKHAINKHIYETDIYRNLRDEYYAKHIETWFESKCLPLLKSYHFSECDAQVTQKGLLHNKRYVQIKSQYLNEFFYKKYGIKLDNEQAQALASKQDILLLRARAGSGKTRVLVAKGVLLMNSYTNNPDHVLIMTFNRKASIEVKKRIVNEYKINTHNNSRTFHSLAYQIVRPKQNILCTSNIDEEFTGSLHDYIRDILREIWAVDQEFRKHIKLIFRKEMQEMERYGSLLDDKNYLIFRRNLRQITLKGEPVKSIGEKYIADFLFEHDIQYTYEPIFSWNNRPYRPDFRIHKDNQDYIIEHWAINPDDKTSKVPFHWSTSDTEYKQLIYQKRGYWSQQKITFIETNASQLKNGRKVFEALFNGLLVKNGFECKILSEEEIQKRVIRIQHERMVKLFIQFIQKCKKRRITPESAVLEIRQYHPKSVREEVFLQLACNIYLHYESKLINDKNIDFDLLIDQAIHKIDSTKGKCAIQIGQQKEQNVRMNDLEYILIDEYQDFSRQFFDLLNTIQKYNKKIHLFCVGDDWQAINSFAGSDLKYFSNFGQYFQNSQTLNLLTNYRSAKKIVEFGNELMAGEDNPAQAQKGTRGGSVKKININDIFIEWSEQNKNNYLEDYKFRFYEKVKMEDGTIRDKEKDNGSIQARYVKAIYEILTKEENKAIYEARNNEKTKGLTCAIISRTNHFYYLPNLKHFKEKLINCLAKDNKDKKILHENIQCGTAHGFKGLEADIVFILKVCNGTFPLIHPDTELFGFFDEDIYTELESERRLFYVAATRAKEKVYCLYEEQDESDFIKDIKGFN